MQKAIVIGLTLLLLVATASCSEGDEVSAGPPGPPGPAGDRGEPGTPGANGPNGTDPVDAATGDASPPPAKQGTRLKTRTATVTTTTTTSDGAETVTSYPLSEWFDTVRNEPCTFTIAADDKTRCLPTSLAIRDYSSGSYFNDASCTQPIAFTLRPASTSCGATTLPPSPPPKYMIFSKSDSSCGGTGIRPLGAPLVPGPTIYLKTSSTCFATTPLSSYDYYTMTTEIPPAEFVESSTTIVTSYAVD